MAEVVASCHSCLWIVLATRKPAAKVSPAARVSVTFSSFGTGISSLVWLFSKGSCAKASWLSSITGFGPCLMTIALAKESRGAAACGLGDLPLGDWDTSSWNVSGGVAAAGLGDLLLEDWEMSSFSDTNSSASAALAKRMSGWRLCNSFA